MFKLKNLKFLVIAMAAVGVAACSDNDELFGDGEDGGGDGGQASLRVLHGVADAPRVNVFLDGSLVLEAVDFREASPFLGVEAGSYDVRVEAIVPGPDPTVISVAGLPIEPGSALTIVAVGDVTQGNIAPLPLAEPTEEIAAGNFRLQVTHGSVDAPPVWVALTTPDAPIDQAEFVGPLSFTETFGPGEFAAGNYQVRVVAIDPSMNMISDADVLFDSGALELPEGADLHVVALTSTVPSIGGSAFAPEAAVSPISLVVLDASAGAGEAGGFDVFDANTGSNLTIVHDAPGIPAVDVFADIASTAPVEEIQLTDDLVYGDFEPTFAAPALDYNVGVRLASDNSADAFGFEASLMAGMGYTAIARLVDGVPEAQLLVDDYRSVATAAKVRLVHGSPSAGSVDVYIFESDAENPPLPGNDTPLLLIEGFEYGAETGFVDLAAGSYDIYVTLGGTTTVAIPVPGLEVAAGGVYTAIARDPEPEAAEFGVILIADTAAVAD